MSGASERLGRLLALVPYLLARPGARVEDVARAFDVPESRLVDDLQLLFVCGLPGHMPDDLIEADLSGGRVTVSNADTIARPLRLAPDEALALLVGLRALADTRGEPLAVGMDTRTGEGDPLSRALAKLERAAGDAAALAASVEVRVEAAPEALSTVRDALARRRRVHLSYYVPGRDEVTERDVDPMRLLVVDGRTYLEGWCRRVEDVRLFRLDRVVAVAVLDVAAEVPSAARGRDVAEGLFRPSDADEVVTLQLAPAARWVADHYPCESVTEAGDGALRVSLRTPDTRWVARLVLSLGGTAHVVDPPALRTTVRERAAAGLRGYDDLPAATSDPAGEAEGPRR